MEEYKLEIKKVNNGYILKGQFNDNFNCENIIEIQDKEDGELMAMEDLLYQIKEYFGLYYSKHNKKNLIIEIEKIEGE